MTFFNYAVISNKLVYFFSYPFSFIVQAYDFTLEIYRNIPNIYGVSLINHYIRTGLAKELIKVMAA